MDVVNYMYGKVIEHRIGDVTRFETFDCMGMAIGCHVVRANSPVSLRSVRAELYNNCSGDWVLVNSN